MQHIVTEKYPVIGWLINNALDSNRRIHRATLVHLPTGSINVYYHMGTFILECDTDGDHNPNEYFFFADVEKTEIHNMLEQMLNRLGVENLQKISELVDHTLQFISNDFTAE